MTEYGYLQLWSERQWPAISWIPHVTGSFSILGSAAIIYMILSDWEKKLAKPSHRLMLSMSFFDVLQSAALAMSTLAFPKETLVYGSIGSMQTCKAQYFFYSLGLAVPMYNASLCLLYLLTIRYRLHQRRFSKKVEPFLHISSVLIPLSIAIVPIVMDDVVPGEGYCVMSLESPVLIPGQIIAGSSFFVCLYSMVSISCFVNAQSNKMRRYSYGRAMRHRESERRATIRRAIFYTLAFVITFLFLGVRTLVVSYPVTILKSIFYPLQGFWNFLLYIRPVVTKRKKMSPDKPLYKVVWSVIFHSNENNEVRQQRIISEISTPIQNGANSGADMKDRISKNQSSLCITNKKQISGGSTSYEENINVCMNSDEGASVAIETGSDDESVVRRASLVLATADYDHENTTNEENIDVCMNSDEDPSVAINTFSDDKYVMRRASLVFATALDLDDLSISSSCSS